MSRISRVLFPESSLQRMSSSPSRDRLSMIDSLAAISMPPPQSFPEKKSLRPVNVNRTTKSRISSRRVFGVKKQNRVPASCTSDSAGNSLMNIGQLENDANSKQKRTSSSRINVQQLNVLANIGNTISSSSDESKKKKKITQRVSFDTKVEESKQREERYLKRSLTRQKNVSLVGSENNEKIQHLNKHTYEDGSVNVCESKSDSLDTPTVEMDCDGVNFEISSSPESGTKESATNSDQLVKDGNGMKEKVSRRRTEIIEEILSPSVAPKPLKRHDNKLTPDVKSYQPQATTASPYRFDNVQDEAEATVQVVFQANSIVALTDVSKMSNEDIEKISKIQARAIVLACPHMCFPRLCENTKPSTEQINSRIELQTKALVHAYKQARDSARNKETESPDQEHEHGRIPETNHVRDMCRSPLLKPNVLFDNLDTKESEVEFAASNSEEIKPITYTSPDLKSGNSYEKSEDDSSKNEYDLEPVQNPLEGSIKESSVVEENQDASIKLNELQNENSKKYIGRRVAGYFPRFKKYFLGSVEKVYNDDEEEIFKIKYDDGDEEYILFSDEEAVEGRDLKRLLENYERHGEEITEKTKKTQRIASKSLRRQQSKVKSSSSIKDCSGDKTQSSLRPRRNIRPVERLEINFRRKKKKQVTQEDQIHIDQPFSDEMQVQMNSKITSVVRRARRSAQPIQAVNNSRTDSKRMHLASKISNTRKFDSSSDHTNGSTETSPSTNDYLKLREQKIARNQEKLKELGLIEKRIPRHVEDRILGDEVSHNIHDASKIDFEDPKNCSRSSRTLIERVDTLSVADEEEEKAIFSFDQELDDNVWDRNSLSRLKRAHAASDPTSSNFWNNIAMSVGDRSAEECRDKWFELFNINETKPKASSKIYHERVPSSEVDDDDDIFNSTPFKSKSNFQFNIPSSTRTRNPLSRLSDVLSSPIFNKLNMKKKLEDIDSCEIESPRVFRSQYKSYVKEVKAGGFDKKNKFKSRKCLLNIFPKGRLRATAESGEIHMQGQLSPGGTLRVEQPDEDEIENARLYEDDYDIYSDNHSL